MIDSRNIFILGLLMAMVTVVSCKDQEYEKILLERQKVEDSIAQSIEGKTARVPKDHFETIVFEGCEYLIYKEEPDSNSAFGFMAHKGNCSNPIHENTEE